MLKVGHYVKSLSNICVWNLALPKELFMTLKIVYNLDDQKKANKEIPESFLISSIYHPMT